MSANVALMALLIGARLGEQALSTSAAAPTARLPDLFGLIAGVERLNRTVGDAAELLNSAEQHLVRMDIPYALSVHGAFVAAAVEMLREDGRDTDTSTWDIPWRSDIKQLELKYAHEYVAERCEAELPSDLLALFHITRRLRNRIIHFAGVAGSRLPTEYNRLPSSARTSWERLAGRPVTVNAQGHLELAEGELIATLAISRHLAQTVNEMLVRTLSRRYWASVVVEDYRTSWPQRYGERDQRLRRLRGHARTWYRSLHLSDQELLEAVKD